MAGILPSRICTKDTMKGLMMRKERDKMTTITITTERKNTSISIKEITKRDTKSTKSMSVLLANKIVTQANTGLELVTNSKHNLYHNSNRNSNIKALIQIKNT